jgi:D-serine deaminase-like pyridoxal phosphate-dependent protein
MASIAQIHNEMLQKLEKLQNELRVHFSSDLEYSVGDTPSCSVMDEFGVATELRPGNFVFYDVMQYSIGSNKYEDIAVVMACPVVAIHADRNEIVIYGGSIHFSKDSIQDHQGQTIYGLPVTIAENSWNRQPWEESWVYKLSQEHGIIKVPPERLSKVQIGDWIGILPVHSCLTADCMGEYLTLTGERIDHMRQHLFR